jgi:hypothetical protein
MTRACSKSQCAAPRFGTSRKLPCMVCQLQPPAKLGIPRQQRRLLDASQEGIIKLSEYRNILVVATKFMYPEEITFHPKSLHLPGPGLVWRLHSSEMLLQGLGHRQRRLAESLALGLRNNPHHNFVFCGTGRHGSSHARPFFHRWVGSPIFSEPSPSESTLLSSTSFLQSLYYKAISRVFQTSPQLVQPTASWNLRRVTDHNTTNAKLRMVLMLILASTRRRKFQPHFRDV